MDSASWVQSKTQGQVQRFQKEDKFFYPQSFSEDQNRGIYADLRKGCLFHTFCMKMVWFFHILIHRGRCLDDKHLERGTSIVMLLLWDKGAFWNCASIDGNIGFNRSEPPRDHNLNGPKHCHFNEDEWTILDDLFNFDVLTFLWGLRIEVLCHFRASKCVQKRFNVPQRRKDACLAG